MANLEFEVQRRGLQLWKAYTLLILNRFLDMSYSQMLGGVAKTLPSTLYDLILSICYQLFSF